MDGGRGEDDRPAAAGRRARRFRSAGIEATGDVGDERPLQAIADLLGRDAFDEIVLSTFPPGMSRWLRLDLPHRVEASYGLPVRHVIAPREQVEV